MSSELGQQIGRFRLVSRLGSGGFASVYRAEDTALDREVAIKILHPHLADDAAFVRRFRAEARVAARLRHPHIVTIYEVGESSDNRPYLVMALLEGTLLSRLIAEHAPLPLDPAAAILSQLASALDYLHAQGLVHRDLKPANVMIGESGDVTLMDFGIARSLDDQAHMTQTGQIIGTPTYMAPEQLTGGEATVSTDVYALGILAYELFAGRPPFSGSLNSVIVDQINKPPPPIGAFNANVPPSAAQVIERALAKNPAARPRTAGELAGLIIGDSPTSPLTPPAASLIPPIPAGAQAPGAGADRIQPVTTASGSVPARRTAPAPLSAAGATRAEKDGHSLAAPGGQRGLLLGVIAAAVAVIALTIGGVVFARSRAASHDHTPARASQTSSVTVVSTSGSVTARAGAATGVGGAGAGASATRAAGTATASPAPTTPARSSVAGFKVCDTIVACKQTNFAAVKNLVACFALTPGLDTQTLEGAVTTERLDPPAGVNDPAVLARSRAIPQTSGVHCVPMAITSGALAAGTYTAWVLQGKQSLARFDFTTLAPPTPTPTQSPTPKPAPPPAPATPVQRATVVAPVYVPTPVRSAPVATAAPVQTVQSVQPVQTAAPATQAPAAVRTPPPR